MSNFTEEVEFLSTNMFLKDRRLYRLTRDLLWEIGHKGSGNYVLIEKGYLTDFISVPRILSFIINSSGKYAAAGALHDKLYDILDFNRKFADDQLYDALVALGANKVLAFLAWTAVRLLGRQAFKDKKSHGAARFKKTI